MISSEQTTNTTRRHHYLNELLLLREDFRYFLVFSSLSYLFLFYKKEWESTCRLFFSSSFHFLLLCAPETRGGRNDSTHNKKHKKTQKHDFSFQTKSFHLTSMAVTFFLRNSCFFSIFIPREMFFNKFC